LVFEAFDAESIAAGIGILIAVIFIAKGIRVVRPTERMAVERLGKFERIKDQGIT
jgi:regulator of protease activity HflC (stomatin/prohibitin superfamily)